MAWIGGDELAILGVTLVDAPEALIGRVLSSVQEVGASVGAEAHRDRQPLTAAIEAAVKRCTTRSGQSA